MRLLQYADPRNPALVNNFVEVADDNMKYGLLCYDDVDAKTLEVLCRSGSRPQYFHARRHMDNTAYIG